MRDVNILTKFKHYHVESLKNSVSNVLDMNINECLYTSDLSGMTHIDTRYVSCLIIGMAALENSYEEKIETTDRG